MGSFNVNAHLQINIQLLGKYTDYNHVVADNYNAHLTDKIPGGQLFKQI